MPKTKTTVISTRDFIRNFSKISSRSEDVRYIVVKHGKPIFVGTPYSESDDGMWWNSMNEGSYPEADKKTLANKRMSLADLRKLSFRSGENNLSQRIDEIVYGIKR